MSVADIIDPLLGVFQEPLRFGGRRFRLLHDIARGGDEGAQVVFFHQNTGIRLDIMHRGDELRQLRQIRLGLLRRGEDLLPARRLP